MKKIGRRSIEKVVRVVTVSQEIAGDPAVDGLLDRSLNAKHGDAVVMHSRKSKHPARMVLLRPVDAPRRDVGEVGCDFIYNRSTVRQSQRWEAAFIGRGRR